MFFFNFFLSTLTVTDPPNANPNMLPIVLEGRCHLQRVIEAAVEATLETEATRQFRVRACLVFCGVAYFSYQVS